ncbi:hypothetical protein KKF55_01375 [Patescibacteria group bacterium]|nr:hypothetical protein [Patescibacteria group bacterium]
MADNLLRRLEGVIFAAERLGRLIREQSQERNFSLVLSFSYKRKNKKKTEQR